MILLTRLTRPTCCRFRHIDLAYKQYPNVLAVNKCLHIARDTDGAFDAISKLLTEHPYETSHTELVRWYNETLKNMLNMLVRRKQYEKLEQITDLMQQNNIMIPTESRVKDVLVNAATGRTAKAIELTESLIDRDDLDLRSVCSLMRALFNNKEIERAEELVKKYENKISPSLKLHADLMLNHILSANYVKATEVYQELRQRNIPLSIDIYNHAVDAYFKQLDVRSAVKVVMQDMHNANVRIDLKTLENILVGINVHGQLGQYSYPLFDFCVKKGVTCTPRMYHVLINSYLKLDLFNRVELAAEEMKTKFNLIPMNYTYSNVISAYARKEGVNSPNTQRWLAELEAKFSKYKNTSLHALSCMLLSYIAMEDLQKAQKIFDQHPPLRDAKCYAYMIEGYAESGNIARAKELLDEKKTNGFEIQAAETNAIVNAILIHEKDLQKAQEFISQMHPMYNVSPDVTTFNIIINELALNGEVEKAHIMYDHLLREEHLPDPDATTVQIIAMGYAEKNRRAEAEKFVSLLKQDEMIPMTVINAMIKMYERLKVYQFMHKWEERRMQYSNLFSEKTEAMDEFMSYLEQTGV
jgi:pentatricopeptide repeat protein